MSVQSAEAAYRSAIGETREGLTGLALAVQIAELSCQVPLGALAAVPAPEAQSPGLQELHCRPPGCAFGGATRGVPVGDVRGRVHRVFGQCRAA
jgi:hypothetical protein